MYATSTKPNLRHGLLLGLLLVLSGCGAVSVPFISQAPEPAPPVAQTTESTAEAAHEMPSPAVQVPVPRLKSGNQALFDRAVDLQAQGKLDAAEVLLSELTESQPELAGPWINLALIRLAQEDIEGAQAALHEAVSANPSNCDARNQLGILLRREGKFFAAEQQYHACLKVDPTRADVQLNLGILYELYMGRLNDALVAYSEYQVLAGQPDQQVAGWVADLERRVAAIARR